MLRFSKCSLTGPPCTPYSAMGLRTKENHPAYRSHQTYYEYHMKQKTKVMIIENVPEYEVAVVTASLGPEYELQSCRLDPRALGTPTGRARVFIIAWRKDAMTWQGPSMAEMLEALRKKPVMHLKQYFWMKLPKQELSASMATGLQLAPNSNCS